MDPRDERRDVSSPQSYTDSQWSPPPRFQDHDQIYTAQGSPQSYSPHPNSPPQVSPPLEYQEEFHHSSQNRVQPYGGGYNQEYSTEKETPYATQDAHAALTPDYSGPQVVPGQQFYSNAGRPLSPSSNGGTTLMSPQMRPYTFKEHVDDPMSRPGTAPPPVPPKDDRKCGMKKRKFFILVGCVLIWLLALALGLGLGLGLGLKKKDNTKPENTPVPDKVDPFCRQKPEYCMGGSLNANYFSKKGVFNGTGIALAGESWNKGQRRLFTLYFQHHTGDIRFMQYTTDQQWQGGSRVETIATDAKNATPISAVAFGINATQYFHIFYIDKNNIVKQITKSNTSDLWQPGPLSKLNLKALDAPSAGLQACWKGNFYGDSDYSKFPTSSGLQNQVPFEERKGMNIWYAVDDSTFEQYTWYNGADTWQLVQQKWSGFNGHAGVGCYSWGEGTTTYAMMANKNNDVEFWWKDTNINLTSAENHPINSWQKSTKPPIRGANPMTSLGYTTYFYAQMADRSIKGYNITYQAENTTFQGEPFTVTDPAGPSKGIAGTHLTVTAYAEMNGNVTVWDSLYVFYQTQGDDITAFTRKLSGGQWTKGMLTIPDT